MPVVLKLEAKLTRFLSIAKQSLISISYEKGNAVKKKKNSCPTLSWDDVFQTIMLGVETQNVESPV